MVVFTCNNCGDSLQKPKVAKHYQFQCRNPVFVTCVDCLKDFRGEEYVVHTKCITENERYGGKNYTPKQGINKGEKKQQAWLNIVQNVLSNSNNLTVSERNILNSISRHENIPRKKAKFINFIQNMSSNRANIPTVESVWQKMENAFKEATVTATDSQENKKQNVNVEENHNNSNIFKEKDNLEDIEETNKMLEMENIKIKKSKKRPLETVEHKDGKQICKRKNENIETNTAQENNIVEDSKFGWKAVILNIIAIKGEISIKKLRKKAVSQYLANFPDSTVEKATSKFQKKLKKLSNISIVEDKVKLSST